MEFGLHYPAAGTVKVCDPFWTPHLAKLHHVTLPYVLDRLDEHGHMQDYAIVAGLAEEGASPLPFADGLLCETIRGASDFLRAEYDAALDARLDGIIALIAAAGEQDPDGYLCTTTTIREPEHRWGENGGDLVIQHDLYNQGALMEAAVSHYLATGKTTLLVPAVRAANNIARTIPALGIVPGHSLPEDAFVRLYRLFRDHRELQGFAEAWGVKPEEYLKTAEFWYDGRGKKPGSPKGRFTFGYNQNHLPFRQQMTAEGHAVRAALCYMGACGVAKEARREDFAKPLEAIWQNIVNHKMHISGGIGTRHDIEGFDIDDNLPNNAYLETCAAIALAFFAGELNTILPAADRFDVFERAMHNNILAAIGEDFTHYFYENPLESPGSIRRWAWHGCPCCPPMLLKFYGALGSYIYQYSESDVYVNLFLGSSLETEGFRILQEAGTIRLDSRGREMTLRVRIPWYAKRFRLTRNGKKADYTVENGYAVLRRVWDGTPLEISMDAPPVRICANPNVEADRGLVAVMQGPWLYCAEGADNGGSVDFTVAERPNLRRDGEYILGDTADGGSFRLIPYYKWAERENSGPMRVWLPQEKMPPTDTGDALYTEYEEDLK